MKRFLASFLVFLLALGSWNATAVIRAGGTGQSVEYKLAHGAIPVGLAPTGTMANNGAVTLGTALNTTYASAYLYYPAGAIAAGVPASADFYYTVMSSATVGQVFNNLLSANVDANGIPQVPASPTAFVTTGPGAFTGVTSAVTLLTLTVPAGAMGTNGVYRLDLQSAENSTAGARTIGVLFGGTSMYSASQVSSTQHHTQHWVNNRNSASIQSMHSQWFAASSTQSASAYAAINTGNAVSVTVTITRAVATDTYMVENVTEWITNQ